MEATELTWADQVYQEGREEGRVQGLREAIERLARVRFGSMTPELEARLVAITREDELAALIDRVGQAQSEAELLSS